MSAGNQQLADRAALFTALAALACRCGRADWRVVSTQQRVRYLKCGVCGRTSKVIVRRAKRKRKARRPVLSAAGPA